MRNKTTVLIIEDEATIRNFMTAALMGSGYKVLTARDGQQGLVMTSSYRPDIILLDLGLPDMDGMKMIKSVREWSLVPIIVVSARGMESDKVMTYDYIIKEIWGPYARGDNQILRVNMANIRRKIEDNPADPRYIITEVGVGYRMNEEG